ncbi:hypothetical protein GPS44_03120 [Acinetobacter haemolyticus]|nr:hypothetical protein [Acinetobacter haemolyticus]
MFVILMLCNGLFFAYAGFDQTNANAFKVNTQQITEHIDSKHGYIN